MRNDIFLAILGLGIALGFCRTAAATDKPPTERAPGLLVTYTDHPAGDGARKVSQVVMLPELGLALSESPHPAISPSFTASYEGVLMVAVAGRYEFDSDFALSLDGKPVTGGLALDAGPHALRLHYERPAGAVRVGLSWQSEHFIKEPVPPTVLWHERTALVGEKTAGGHPSPPHRIEQALASMKCASCHEADFLATMHHKFAPDTLLTHIRHANPMKWYGAMTGPLLEESETLTQLAEDLRKLPLPERRRGEPAADLGKGLHMVGSKGGFACIACHDIKHHRTAAESKGPNLAFITQRVSYDWFVRWMTNPQRLKPGVAMPPFLVAQSPEQQKQSIDALWDYLSQGDKMALPDELIVDPQQFVLKPGSTPLFNRAYLTLPDGRELLRAICVGLPNGVSYCFDAETCQLAYVWTGGYLDMAPHWKNQSGYPTPPVGEAFFLPSPGEGLRIGELTPVFHGYELVGGIPRFEFGYGDTTVRLMIDAPTADGLQQTFTIAGRAEPVQFVGPPAGFDISITASVGEWTGNRLTVSETGEVELLVVVKKGK
jgi:hypothetical protein